MNSYSLEHFIAKMGPIAVRWLVDHGLKIVLIFLMTYLGLRAIPHLINRITQIRTIGMSRKTNGGYSDIERDRKAATISRVLKTTSSLFLSTLAFIMILKEIGIDIAPLLAGAGVVGLAVGFGAQSLVKDVIMGFFLIFENQIRVGDSVTVGGVSGVVEDINLRTLMLRSGDGTLSIIPNGEIKVVQNRSYGWVQVILDLPIPHHVDFKRALSTLEQALTELKAQSNLASRFLSNPTVTGIENFTDSGVILRIAVKTAPNDQDHVAREIRNHVKIALEREAIPFSAPHRILTLSTPPGTLK